MDLAVFWLAFVLVLLALVLRRVLQVQALLELLEPPFVVVVVELVAPAVLVAALALALVVLGLVALVVALEQQEPVALVPESVPVGLQVAQKFPALVVEPVEVVDSPGFVEFDFRQPLFVFLFTSI